MKLLDSTYFSRWNLISNINEPDPNNRVIDDLTEIVNYSVDYVLLKALGRKMYNDFKPYVLEGGFDDNAPQLYKDIVYGKEYEKDGKSLFWVGLIEEPKASLIADFAYYTYKTHNATLSNEFGEVKVNSKIATNTTITPKVTEAHNRFVSRFNGGVRSFPSGYTMEGKPFWIINGGVDYCGVYDFGEISLIKFLLDNKEYYPLFDNNVRRFGFEFKNEFGL